MLQIRKLLAALTAVIVVAIASSSCTTASNSSMQTGSIGYGSADLSLRPACRGGFGNDRPCSY
ncbi:hypothetical protein ACCS54_01335 [Rhizobium johnstonii]|uniref:hypothetical protein n=1 Tax=Rhizobium TaxID=379 RepID=UPI000491EC42|nr:MULTISPECIES: hypothetical protein [Rhizobium]MBY5345362.1 hypothetical protein [Rhizobium leguminosarum]MBY5375683.1 hypothetical protein [Rhizobium leguminosarum]MBY5388928.1 hypothetical protein [Rhizobium leguminosarum]MBY5417474.1 hypothetical protein [Rhizobium leguminosarum]MBY5430725.1 hypothetical protein [Rhizobium leguminosarum]